MREHIDAAIVRGELGPIWNELLRLVERGRAGGRKRIGVDDAAIDTDGGGISLRARPDHGGRNGTVVRGTRRNAEMISAITLCGTIGGTRWRMLNQKRVDYSSAPNELRELLVVELILIR